jgi:membrane protein CcdC involved in cytochrome C biogenesis
MTSNPQLIAVLVASPLIAWRMYSRIRRMVGRQRSTPLRPWIPVIVFPIVITLIAFANIVHPTALAALLGGIAIGTTLGVYGLKLTKFEKNSEGLFYTPNAHLGIALSLLLVGRLIYRIVQVSILSADAAANNFGSSPITLAILGTLAAYYVTYALGHLMWRHKVNRVEI